MARWWEYFGKFYLIKLPELELFPDEETRRDAMKRVQRELRPRRSIQLAGLFIFVLTIPFMIALRRKLSSLFQGDPWVAGIFSGLMAGGAGLAVTWLWRRDASVYLRQRLLDCGVPVCLGCGYCLRGLTSERCPECGMEVPAIVRDLIASSAGTSMVS